APRQVECLEWTQRSRQLEDLVPRQVVALVEARPVEAMLAAHVARRVDEQDEEGRSGLADVALERDARVARRSLHQVHGCVSASLPARAGAVARSPPCPAEARAFPQDTLTRDRNDGPLRGVGMS